MLELICIDDRVQEDLLFLDQLCRAVRTLLQNGRQFALLLGSTERTERSLETEGWDVSRRLGALEIQEKAQILYERSMREENRRVSGRLTEKGIHAVGFLGSDRGFLKMKNGRCEPSESLYASAWPVSEVVPVISCSAGTTRQTVVDVHPLAVAAAISSNTSLNSMIVYLTQRVMENTKRSMEVLGSLELNALEPEWVLPDWVDLDQFSGKMRVSHVSWLGQRDSLKIS